MNKLTLKMATTLSVLALTFSGAASADNGSRFHDHKLKNVVKTTNAHKVNRNKAKKIYRAKTTKRVVYKRTPIRKVVTARTVVNKPTKAIYTSNKRVTQMKKYKQRVNYKNRYKRNSQYKTANRFKAKRAARQSVYSVRSGDTLMQISFITGVSVDQLARLNRIKHANLNYLKIGQVLKLA